MSLKVKPHKKQVLEYAVELLMINSSWRVGFMKAVAEIEIKKHSIGLRLKKSELLSESVLNVQQSMDFLKALAKQIGYNYTTNKIYVIPYSSEMVLVVKGDLEKFTEVDFYSEPLVVMTEEDIEIGMFNFI